MAQIETESTTTELLWQWALWITTGDRLGYSHISPMWIGKLKRKGLTPNITDDEAVLVDGILADLRRRDPQMGEITIEYYMSGGSIFRLAKRHRIDRRKVDALVKSGTAWVDGVLFYRRGVA